MIGAILLNMGIILAIPVCCWIIGAIVAGIVAVKFEGADAIFPIMFLASVVGAVGFFIGIIVSLIGWGLVLI